MGRLSFRCADEMVQRVDRARKGSVSTKAREAWLRDAVEIALRQAEAVEAMARDESGEYQRRAAEQASGETDREHSQQVASQGRGESPSGHDAGAVPVASPATSPAPAEQPKWEGFPVRTDERVPRGRVAGRALEEPSAPGLASRSAETLAPAEQLEPRRSGPIPKSPSTRDRLEIERIRREQFDNANRLIAAKRKKKR